MQGKELAQRQESEMLLLRRHEKDFLARHDVKYEQRFEDVAQRIITQQAQLDQRFQELDVDATAFNNLADLFRQYRAHFLQLVEAQKAMGLTQNEGLEGELRASVHDIESSLNTLKQDSMLVTMLQLRRHEKDFMLRLDMKYPARFAQTLKTLTSQIEQSSISGNEKASLLGQASNYGEKFNAYVAQQQVVGLSSSDGILGQMRETIHKTESKLQAMARAMSDKAEQLMYSIRVAMLSVFVVVVLAAGLIAWRISASINRPLSIIRNAMVEVDQTRNLSTRVMYDGRDEIGDVSRSINQMLSGFQDVVQSVNQTVFNMNERTKTLSETSVRTARDADLQRDETDMVAASVAEMVGTVEEISRSMAQAKDKSAQTQSSAAEGQVKVNSAIERIQGLATRLENSMTTADDLAKESESIGTVLSVIQGIAEQTNLLALNAAIEAARAGEQGRGFAVVADEVRALASRTHDATVEISEIIVSLQSRTHSIVPLIKECREDGLKSSDEAAIAGEVLDKIISEVDEIADMATSVATAIEQQTIAANEISKNVESIRRITMDTSESVALNSASSEEISDQSSYLQQTVAIFKLS